METKKDISEELKNLEATTLLRLKDDMPMTPTIDFDALQDVVMNEVSKETKIIPIYKKPWAMGSLAIAASVALVLSVYTPQNTIPETTSFEPSMEISMEVLVDEVDYLDEDLLAEAYVDLVYEDVSLYEEILLEEDYDIEYLFDE
jgi:hypothetical protein